MGFGTAFSRAFMEVDAQLANAKQDRFRLAYDRIERNRTAYAQAEAEDKRLIKQAKFLTSRVPGIPSDAWMDAYEALSNGMSPDAVLSSLSSTSYRPIAQPPAPPQRPQQNVAPQQQGRPAQNQSLPQPGQFNPPSNGPRAQSGMGMNQQNNNMQQQPRYQQQAPQPQPQPNMLEQAVDFFNPANIQQRQVQAANTSAATEMGLTPEQVQQYQTGYTPAELTKTYEAVPIEQNDPLSILGLADGVTPAKWIAAQARAEYLRKNPQSSEDIKFVQSYDAMKPLIEQAQASGKDANEYIADKWAVIKPISDAYAPIGQAKADVKSAIYNLMALDTIAAANPEVLTSTAGFASVIQSMGTEISTAISLAAEVFKSNPNTTEDDFMKILGENIDGNAISRMSEANREFYAAATRTIYSLAKAAGQSGQGLSNADVQRWTTALLNSTEYDAFKKNLLNISNEQISKVDYSISAFMAQPSVKYASDIDGVNAYINYENLGVPLSEELANDPDISAWLTTNVEAPEFNTGKIGGNVPMEQSIDTGNTPFTTAGKSNQELFGPDAPDGDVITITQDWIDSRIDMTPEKRELLKAFIGQIIILTRDNTTWMPPN